jgi:hypothetical protein
MIRNHRNPEQGPFFEIDQTHVTELDRPTLALLLIKKTISAPKDGLTNIGPPANWPGQNPETIPPIYSTRKSVRVSATGATLTTKPLANSIALRLRARIRAAPISLPVYRMLHQQTEPPKVFEQTNGHAPGPATVTWTV